MTKKFRFDTIKKDQKQYMALDDILHGSMPKQPYDAISQWLGLCDAGQNEIYERDVLELPVTAALMDPMRSTFRNSNLGKKIREMPDVISAVLLMTEDSKALGCHYELFFLDRDLHILRDEDGNTDVQASGSDSWFPMYLCEKGARVVTDLAQDPSALYNMEAHTLWAKDPSLKAELEQKGKSA